MTKKKALTRDALMQGLSSRGFKTAYLDMPDFDGPLRLRELNQAEKEILAVDFSGSMDGKVDVGMIKGFSGRLIFWCAIDEDGNRLFQNEDEELVDRMIPPQYVIPAMREVLLLSGMAVKLPTDDTEPKETEESETPN